MRPIQRRGRRAQGTNMSLGEVDRMFQGYRIFSTCQLNAGRDISGHLRRGYYASIS